ncbi:MAG: hypothetical protein RR817_11075 [Niameybacter sp.]
MMKVWQNPKLYILTVDNTESDLMTPSIGLEPTISMDPTFELDPVFDETPSVTTGPAIGLTPSGGGDSGFFGELSIS